MSQFGSQNQKIMLSPPHCDEQWAAFIQQDYDFSG